MNKRNAYHSYINTKKRTEDKEESNCWTKSPVNKSVTEHSLYKIDDIKIIDKEPLEGNCNSGRTNPTGEDQQQDGRNVIL